MVAVLGRHWRIDRQYPLIYKPKTIKYGDLAWKVDFRIVNHSSPSKIYFVEAKGDWIYADTYALAELQHKIQFLEFCNPYAWDRLVIVGDKQPKVLDNVQSFGVQEFQVWLKSLCPMK